jgi:PKD repeat protein
MQAQVTKTVNGVGVGAGTSVPASLTRDSNGRRRVLLVAASGEGSSHDISVEGSHDGGTTWFTLGSFAFSTTGYVETPIMPLVRGNVTSSDGSVNAWIML